jgi:hypothetical protein
MPKFALVSALLLFAGCGTMRVRSEVAPQAQLAQYRTYAWMPAQGAGPETIVDQQIRAALAKQLSPRGMTEAASVASADFLIGYHVLQERKITQADWGNGIYGWAPEVVAYSDGALILDFIDPRTNRIFWRGQATSAIETPGVVNVKRLEKAATELVRHYPQKHEPSTGVASAQ